MSKQHKTLTLKRETLVQLTHRELGAAQGGTTPSITITATVTVEAADAAGIAALGIQAVRQAHLIAGAVSAGVNFLTKHQDHRPVNKVPGARIIK